MDKEKIKDILFNSIPEDMYVVKEVDFNSDVLNSENYIFFPTDRNMFTLYRYPARGEMLPINIRDAVKFFDREFCYRPKMVFIAFNVYAVYAVQDYGDFCMPTVEMVCRELGLDCKVMIPDRLKENVKGTTDNAKWHI